MNGWQPIATAPKDATRILLFTGAPGESVEIGHFAPPDETEPESTETWTDSGNPATHWQPLPEPPVSP